METLGWILAVLGGVGIGVFGSWKSVICFYIWILGAFLLGMFNY